MGRRIALIVDNPYRDLGGLVLVAMRLCASGATCYLVPFNWREPELWALAPDFVLMNYLRVKNEWLVRRLSEAGIGVGVLDTEGGALSNLDDYAQVMAQDAQVRQSVACFLTWGPRLADHAVAAGWFDRRQVAVTGAPRMDFYAPSWHQVALRTSAVGQTYAENLLLVNGNYPVANPAFATPEEEARSLVVNAGFPPERVAAWQRVQLEGMERLSAVANLLASRFPQATVVYRPHPFERTETYDGLIERRDNLHLVKAGTVDGWILRARAVVQRSCSTAIEAALVGVPALSPSWIPAANELPAAEGVSVPCRTEDDLVSAVDQVLAGKWRSPPEIVAFRDQMVRDWFLSMDGRAHERVAETIERHTDGRRPPVQVARCRDMLYGLNGSAMSARRRAYLRLRRLTRVPIQWSFTQRRLLTESPWDRSDKAFGLDDIQRLAQAIEEASRVNGSPLGPVSVGRARHGADYIARYHGRSIKVAPVGPA